MDSLRIAMCPVETSATDAAIGGVLGFATAHLVTDQTRRDYCKGTFVLCTVARVSTMGGPDYGPLEISRTVYTVQLRTG